MELLKNESKSLDGLKYTSGEVIYAMRDKGMGGGLKESCDIYKEDRKKWQDWYEKEVVIPKKLIPLSKAKEWLKENVNNYLYNTGGCDEYIPKCGDKMFTDFEKAMMEK